VGKNYTIGSTIEKTEKSENLTQDLTKKKILIHNPKNEVGKNYIPNSKKEGKITHLSNQKEGKITYSSKINIKIKDIRKDQDFFISNTTNKKDKEHGISVLESLIKSLPPAKDKKIYIPYDPDIDIHLDNNISSIANLAIPKP
jgi:hypothetical protein